LSDATQVDIFTESIRERDIQMLINNAGFGTSKFFHQEPLDLKEKMIAAHILAHTKITDTILPGMIQKAAGIIINVTSSGTFLPSPKTAVYSGTKAYLRAFTECLHYDLEGFGVQVQVVCPGLTWTNMHARIDITEEYMADWGLFQWTSPKEVVACSLRCLAKKKWPVSPGEYRFSCAAFCQRPCIIKLPLIFS